MNLALMRLLGPLALDYYIYADFTENPGNQCYVIPGEACRACLNVPWISWANLTGMSLR